MNITIAFIERLLALSEQQQLMFLKDHTDEIDFNLIMVKTRDIWHEETTTPDKRDKISDLRDNCIAVCPNMYGSPFEPVINNQGEVHLTVNLEQTQQ